MAPIGKHLGVALAALAASCTGPSTRIDNPGGHRVFVDGDLATSATRPFRYYGSQQIDVLPADGQRRADFDVLPQRFAVAVPPPVSPWWFPLDFPGEVATWLLYGTPTTVVTIAPPAVPPEQRVAADYRPTGLELVGERARAARIAR